MISGNRLLRISIGFLLGGLLLGVGLWIYLAVQFARIPDASLLKADRLVDTSVFSVITRPNDPNHVIIRIFGLGGRYRKLTYDLRYESKGEIKHKILYDEPLDLSGVHDIDIPVFLGTCEGARCVPDPDVAALWLFLEYTDLSGKVIQTGTP